MGRRTNKQERKRKRTAQPALVIKEAKAMGLINSIVRMTSAFMELQYLIAQKDKRLYRKSIDLYQATVMDMSDSYGHRIWPEDPGVAKAIDELIE